MPHQRTARLLIAVMLLLPWSLEVAGETDAHHGSTHSMGAVGHHRAVEIPPGVEVPEVSLTVVRDSVSGWNLFAEVTHFRFAPERAGGELMPGEGHAHLYVDGKKVARVYGPAYHLGMLAPGPHVVTFTLNSNDHAVYSCHGTPIGDSVTILEPEAMAVGSGPRRVYETPQVFTVSEAVPTVDLLVSPDPHSGWNVHAEIDGFDFAPQSVGGSPVQGQGHAQLYVDGRKVARLYGRSYHVSDLGPGTHRIQVSLVGNDHAPYVHEGEQVAAWATVEVPAHRQLGVSSATD